MTFEDSDRDASVVVDEGVLASVRSGAPLEPGETAGSEGHAAGDGPAASRGGPGAPGEPAVSAAAGVAAAAREVPLIEGYGALREIGRGGFSTVYEALQFEFERWVAIKVLDETITDDTAVADFERECRAMGGLSGHPNIVTVFSSAFTDDRRPCIVMELFPHGNYLQILQRTGPLGLDQLLPVSVRVAGALATAHNRGMVHGDVKPQNIFRSQYELAALGDFGIATLISHRWGSQKTRMSLYYAAPEIIERGVTAASPFADQYSLAATIYTLATGSRLYEGDGTESTRDVLVRTLSEPPSRLGPEFPTALGDVLHKANSRRLQDRFRDLREFAEALVDVEEGLGLSPTAIRVGSDAGRYVGGAVDLSGSVSRSGERRSGPSRETSRDRSGDPRSGDEYHEGPASGPIQSLDRTGGHRDEPAPPEVDRSGDHGRGPSAPAPPGSDRTGDHGRRGPPASADAELSASAVEATVVRPQRPLTPAPAPKADKSAKRRRRRRWTIVVAAVLLSAAVAAVAVTLLGGYDGIVDFLDPPAEDGAAAALDPLLGDGGTDVLDTPAGDGGVDVPVSPAGDGGVAVPVPAPDDADARAAEAPGSIRVEGQHNELVVSWGGPVEGAPPILFYRVQWREPGTAFSEASEVLVASDQTGARIPSLASDTEYEVRVAAENEHGRGDWTEASGATLPVGVPAPPTLQVEPAAGGVVVIWGEPSDGGWPITAYVVEWEDSSGRIDYQRYAAGTTEAGIPDLVGGETYRVRVFAENENGSGGWAEETAVVAVPVPETPAGLAVEASYRTLLVSWEEPPATRWPITEYVLEFFVDGALVGQYGVSPDERSAEVTGLLSGNSYEVHLFAVNEGGFSEPAVAWGSPLDRIAFVSDYEGRDAIYYMDVSVESDPVTVAEIVRVTGSDTRQREGSPSWSPDGSWIAFHRRHPDNSHWQIFIKNIQSGEERQLVCGRDNGWSPTWSPNGELIAYARGDQGNDLWAINVETGETRTLKDKYDADDAYPSWSPDGDMIVFARRDHDPRRSNWYNSRNPREIRVLTGVSTDAADLGVTWLTSSYAEGHYTSPEWSPGGDRIAYSASLSGTAERHVAVMDQAGNALQQLTSDHHDDDPTWSPNGEWVAFARGSDGIRSIYVISSSGGEPEQLLGFPENDYWAPSWAPAGDVSVDPTYDCRS